MTNITPNQDSDKDPLKGSKLSLGIRSQPIEVDTIETLRELVTNSPKPIMIDFYAEWCGPCKALAPRVSDIASEQAGRLLVLKVDIDKLPQAAEDFKIRSIPTLVFLNDAKEQGRIIGAPPKNVISEYILKL